jgi:hypothetical protein
MHSEGLPAYPDNDFSALGTIKRAMGYEPVPHYEPIHSSSNEFDDSNARKRMRNILKATPILLSTTLPELSDTTKVQAATAMIHEAEELAVMSIDSFRAVEQAFIALNLVETRGPSECCRQEARQSMARVCGYIRVRSEGPLFSQVMK